MSESPTADRVRIERGKITLWLALLCVVLSAPAVVRMARDSGHGAWLLPTLGVALVGFGVLAIRQLRAPAIEITEGAIAWSGYHPWSMRRVRLDEVTRWRVQDATLVLDTRAGAPQTIPLGDVAFEEIQKLERELVRRLGEPAS